MRNILIVAGREFRQIASMRSFWLTLLILPLSFGIGAIVPQLVDKDEADRVMVIDRTGGGEARAIAQRIGVERDRAVLTELSRYVQRHHLERAEPGATWAQHDRWYSDADVARFVAAGGVTSAQAKIDRVKAKDTPEFEASKPDYEMVPVPAALAASRRPPRRGAEAGPQSQGDKDAKAVDYVLLVPANFGPSPLVRLWTNSKPSPEFVATVQDVLTRDLRTRFLASQGVAPAAAQTAARLRRRLRSRPRRPAAARAS